MAFNDIPTTEITKLAQSLAEILEPLSGERLKEATVAAIGKHRSLTKAAEDAYLAWQCCRDSDPRKIGLREDYDRASLANRAQIAIVAALTDKLGYIPDAGGEPRAS